LGWAFLNWAFALNGNLLCIFFYFGPWPYFAVLQQTVYTYNQCVLTSSLYTVLEDIRLTLCGKGTCLLL